MGENRWIPRDTFLLERYLTCPCGFRTFSTNNPELFRDQETQLAAHACK